MNDKPEYAYIAVFRKISLALIGVLFLAGTFAECFLQKTLWDEKILLLFVSVSFLSVFFLILIQKRRENLLSFKDTNYGNLLWILSVCWGILLLCASVNVILYPVLLIAMMLSLVLDESLAMAMGIYFDMVISITVRGSGNIVCGFLLLSVFGILLVSLYKKDPKNFHREFVILSTLITVLISLVFFYLNFYVINVQVVSYTVFETVLTFVFTLVVYPRLFQQVAKEKTVSYEHILEEDYPLVREISLYSKAEYVHARRVQRLAGLCTKEIHGQVKTAECGGFYYRLGKIEGAPETENALRTAGRYCFPEDVTAIIYEYGGKERKPQTPESAIVHMADMLVSKMELIDKETMANDWNQDMLIYQTLNELMAQGIYDESGLSMNQFLAVRERLVKEEQLL